MPTIEEIQTKIPSREQMVRRWPRLLRACRWTALLTESEALSGIEGYLMNREFGTAISGPEAVSHFGGPLEVIQSAIRNRRFVKANHHAS